MNGHKLTIKQNKNFESVTHSYIMNRCNHTDNPTFTRRHNPIENFNKSTPIMHCLAYQGIFTIRDAFTTVISNTNAESIIVYLPLNQSTTNEHYLNIDHIGGDQSPRAWDRAAFSLLCKESFTPFRSNRLLRFAT